MNLDDTQKGAIFSAFTLAYALFEIPTGWLGTRSVPAACCCAWCCGVVFTAATGWAWNYVSMLVTRFLFGAARPAAFPT